MRQHILIILLLIGALFGCNENNQVVVMWTNIAEAPFYVELYNAQSEEYKVEVSYYEDIAQMLQVQNEHPDIVMSDDIANQASMSYFAPLDRAMRELLDSGRIYPELLVQGIQNGRTLLLPLSFDLPMMLFDAENPLPDQVEFALQLDQIREIAAESNVQQGSNYTFVGYSPRWNSSFLYLGALFNGAEFREDENGMVNWNQQAIDETIEYFTEWIVAENGGIEAEDTFQRKYLYAAEPPLIRLDRVRFVYSSAAQYWLLSEDTRNQIDFSWIWDGERIPVLDNSVFIGVSNESNNRAGAFEFMRWLFTYENQQTLIQRSHSVQLRSFGIANGFSTLIAINETVIPRQYPQLLDRISLAELLWSQARMPIYWRQLREEVIGHWLSQRLSNEAIESLPERITAWNLRSGGL